MTPLPRWTFWPSVAFWLTVARETLGRRRLRAVLARRLEGRAIAASGGVNVPPFGPFVFAVNHYYAGLTLDVVAATLLAAEHARAHVVAESAIVVGNRRGSSASRGGWLRTLGRALARGARWAVGRFFGRWQGHVVRISTGGEGGTSGLSGLRAWRARAAAGPTLVFPEGAAHGALGPMRPGVGAWLSSLGVPVVPVGVFWDGECFRVAFGAPLEWAARRDLRDVQLGLALAALLPPPLRPAWAELLARVRAIHALAARVPSSPADTRAADVSAAKDIAPPIAREPSESDAGHAVC